MFAGDSHSTALTSLGAVYAWGTYRDATGVFGFAPGKRIGLLPTLVWDPKKSADQAVKVASGGAWQTLQNVQLPVVAGLQCVEGCLV